MRIGRTVPPAAAPVSWRNLWDGLAAAVRGSRAIAAREEELRQAFGVGHVFLLSSGSAALTVALQALRALSSRLDVVLPAYTCFSVPAAVLKAGLRPVLCDIDPSTFDYDHDRLQQTLTSDTLCVITHHLFGVPSDVARTRATCHARGIFIVEDAAQALGVEVGGRKLGTIGDLGVFSFGRGKHITCGAGGAVVTSSREIAREVDRLYQRLSTPSAADTIANFMKLLVMSIFIRPRLYWIPAAMPFLRLGETVFPDDVPLRRMTGMKAGLLRGWQQRLARVNSARSEAAAFFGERLPVAVARPHPYLRLPVLVSNAHERQQLYSMSRARGLGLSAAYPTAVNDIPQIRSAFNGQRFPSARQVADQLLTIPTHHWVSERDRRAIADLWREAPAV